jgi:DivIVA domain-containing protein
MTEGRLAPEEVRTRTFTRVVRGYKRREVRRLLERAATDLVRLRNGLTTNGPDDQLPLTPEEVEEARFQPSLGGYEMDEVDQFLDRLVIELERAAHEPLRPPSALPAPPRRPGLFPPAHGFRPAGAGEEDAPGRDTEVPAAPADEPAAVLSMGPVAGPAAEPTAGREPRPGAGPAVDLPADQRTEVGPGAEPPMVARQPPSGGPFPASQPRSGAGPLPAAQPPPADPAPAARPPQSPAGPPPASRPPVGPPPVPVPEPDPLAGPPPPAPAEDPAATGWLQPTPPPPSAPVGPDEGLFPPPSVPPSAAPAPPPPPPPPAQRPPPVSPARPLTPSEVETRSFDRGAPGYLPTHVDLFLAKAARALAGRDGETMTRWDVLRQRFPLGPRGYATSEVDAFLVRLAAQFPEPDPAAQEEILRKLQQRADGP